MREQSPRTRRDARRKSEVGQGPFRSFGPFCKIVKPGARNSLVLSSSREIESIGLTKPQQKFVAEALRIARRVAPISFRFGFDPVIDRRQGFCFELRSEANFVDGVLHLSKSSRRKIGLRET
jgi:hypothetical protein